MSALDSLHLPKDLALTLAAAPALHLADDVDGLFALATGASDIDFMEVSYPLPDGTTVCEATVTRVRTGSP